jgi:beta-galactosidase
VGWYRKTFTLDQSNSGKRILIQFDGVYMNSQVWINGTSLGTRPYGYSSFEYDLTPYVNFGSTNNVIAVRVNNNQPTSRWYSGSGIYRNVWLTVVNPVHVTNSGVFVATPTMSTTSASISVSTEVQNQSTTTQSVTVTTTISDPSGASVATNTSAASDIATSATATVNQNLTVANPQL